MSASNTNEELSQVTETTTLTFNAEKEALWEVDHREIYRRGFSTLAGAEKDKVLVNLLTIHGAPNVSKMSIQDILQVQQAEHGVWKDREEFNFKKVVWVVGVVVGVLTILGILTAASSGVLTDSGNFSTVLNLIGKIYQQLFGSIPTLAE